jgi:hypothetical protein
MKISSHRKKGENDTFNPRQSFKMLTLMKKSSH